MTDSELLELAAKAADIKAQYSENMGDFSVGEPYSRDECRWNPLAEDGDALRLAVKLNLQVSIVFEDFMHDREFVEVRWDTVEGREFQIREHDGDPYAATRRAIVRAAAEIAKEKAKS